jgi:Cu(I)/Ag(I) efflux system membrane fusion protein/cobalt-zinc-cadmium efflux system membrane fusion protein
VRIVIDGTSKEEALTVPADAVVEIDQKTGLFVPDPAPRTYHFQRVEAGREVDGRRIIRGRIDPGRTVVASGAFALKSELILQNEVDEE